VERAGPQPPARRDPAGDYYASLVYAPGARFVQYRATFRTAGSASSGLQRVTATVIDSPAMAVSSVADQLPTVSVEDADSGRMLAVTTREQWGANERYHFNRRGREIWRGEAVMALLDELRGAIHSGVAGASRAGVALANRTPGGRETTGTTIAYEWAAEPPESGWTLACFESRALHPPRARGPQERHHRGREHRSA
jgi:hypothetical protein